MKRINYLVMAIPFGLLVAMPVALPDHAAAADTILDRHHLLYGSVIPSPTDAPFGTPGALYGCLSCHAVDTSSGSNQFLVERDCQACHSTDRHHLRYNTVIPTPTDAPYGTSGEMFNCFSCHAVDTTGGNIAFTVERDCRVCHDPRTVKRIVVLVDILPGSDENPVNLTARGVLPVLILGSLDYDVTQIDVSSLRLEGLVAPVWAKIQTAKDGSKDLALKFDIQDVSRAVGDLQPGQRREVEIVGLLKDGTAISGSDFIVAVPRGNGGCKGEGNDKDKEKDEDKDKGKKKDEDRDEGKGQGKRHNK